MVPPRSILEQTNSHKPWTSSGGSPQWDRAPSARVAHPAEDHLAPLFVAVGAAESDPGVRTYHEDTFFGAVTVSSYRFGEVPARVA